jgi:alkylation response protein AidB-like acyl-CoA dehydrogenase
VGLAGRTGAVFALGGAGADVVLVPVGDDLVVVEAGSAGLALEPAEGLDPTRRLATVRWTGSAPTGDRIPGGRAVALRLGRLLAAAEAVGVAAAATEAAVAYAKVREQFGRPIGSFPAVKHHCAEMLVHTELAVAATWDAARAADRAGASPSAEAEAALAAAVAAAQALPAARRGAERSIQVHGGIGYTWEHDAHLLLRRAAALDAVFGAEDAVLDDVARLRADGVGAGLAVELPPEAGAFRSEARAFRQRHDALPPGERRAALIESGYLVPHWPTPWGRGAGAVEQLVIDEELHGVQSHDLGIGAWVVLTLVQCGTPDQVERWVRPSLDGDLVWCQLFSEPDAGSDAAAIQTRATRVEGGWLVNGQKVWTSGAQHSNRGLATVRTDPEAPKHAGVTTVAVDMRAPGVTVRPLREITGEALFNEVFLDDVFVPDDDVVGEVGQGWAVARATLGNERVSIGGNVGGVLGTVAAEDLAELAARHGTDDVDARRAVARLLAEARAMAMLNLRHVTRSIVGAGPGPEGNVAKLLSAEHAQRVAGLAVRLCGPAAVDGSEPKVARSYLFTRCLTIAGGTSEIVRNVIAERILGLPRDPLAR